MKQIKREHTIEDIKRIIKNIDERTGKNYAKLPMRIDKRMTSSLGGARTGISRCNGEVVGIKADSFVFSYFLLSAKLTDKDFTDIIMHEYSHLYTNEKYQDLCGHDYRYKYTCEEFGISHMSGDTCNTEIGHEFDEAIRLYKLGILK